MQDLIINSLFFLAGYKCMEYLNGPRFLGYRGTVFDFTVPIFQLQHGERVKECVGTIGTKTFSMKTEMKRNFVIGIPTSPISVGYEKIFVIVQNDDGIEYRKVFRGDDKISFDKKKTFVDIPDYSSEE